MSSQKAHAISVLDTDISRLYTHIHAFLVLSAYFFDFASIVADPVSSLTTLLVPVSFLQITYVAICLPATGSSAPAPSSKGTTQKKGSKSKQNDSLLNRITPGIISLLISLLVGTPLLTTVLILFGAPLTTHLAHTVLCAAHISLLTSLPLVYVYGVDTDQWRRVAALMVPIDEVFGATVGTCLGAWFGAVPIPLDWDRQWQKWPVTIVTGAYIGWALGKSVGGLLMKGMVIDLRP